MTLPAITTPPGTPEFLAAGHRIDEDSAYAQWRPATGHSRARRIWTAQERVVSVEWFLTAAQIEAVEEWFESTLQAGALTFSARVRNQGEGAALLWWEARWVDISYEMASYGRARVSGRLFLTGEGSETAPETGRLAAEFGVALLDVRAVVSAPALLAIEISVELLDLAPMISPQADGGYLERLFVGLTLAPVDTPEFDIASQEFVERSWVET